MALDRKDGDLRAWDRNTLRAKDEDEMMKTFCFCEEKY